MYEQQPLMKIEMRKKMERNISGIEEERLEIVDLSGMSLDSLPSPSLNLATICKLDLSNNNLQVTNKQTNIQYMHIIITPLV